MLKKQLVQGDQAIAEGALAAGLGFFAAYPITPASAIMNYLAKKADKIAFVHAEDEIASINMCIGGSLAGKKSMTSSSGPGISLKQEGIGMAHMAHIPLVVVNCMRVGPSTGMPTLPAQGDIMQVKHGSHGDYYPIALYPNTVEECYKYTIEAFNAAEEALAPVFLLTDGSVALMYEHADLSKIKFKVKNRKRKPLGKLGGQHFTGLFAKDGKPDTMNSEGYRKAIAQRKKEISKVAKNYAFYEYHPNKKSDTLVIAYGVTARVVHSLSDEYAIFRPIRIFPMLDTELKRICKKYKNIVCVEMNDGQYAGEVQKILLREVKCVPILGGAITLKDVATGLRKVLRKKKSTKAVRKKKVAKKKSAKRKSTSKKKSSSKKKTAKKKAVKRKR